MDEKTNGTTLIRLERIRQVRDENWTPEHDDEHAAGELAQAAACYSRQAAVVEYVGNETAYQSTPCPPEWPWDTSWWKPKNPMKDLIRAGALNAAEIDRRFRAAAQRYADTVEQARP